MKIIILTIALMALTLCTNVFARDHVIALSPYQSKSDATSQMKSLILFLTTLDEGDNALLLDGYNIKTIGNFTVPTGNHYKSPKARIAKNKGAIAALKRFTDMVEEPSGGDKPSTYQAVRLPQLLYHIGRDKASREPVNVIVFGSPFYDDPANSLFSMTQGLVPTDGHLKSSRMKSPFGTEGQTDLLNNIHLHLVFNTQNILRNNAHAFAVERFWALYMKLQGGKLAGFTNDMPTIFERVKNNGAVREYDFELGKETSLNMIRFTRDTSDAPIQKRPLSSLSLTDDQIANAKNVEIYLSWDCAACDIDLHARSSVDSQIIYFNRQSTNEGVHFKDFRSSPKADHAYETIAYHVPVNLNDLLIVVSFFSGTAPNGIQATLRLSVNGQTYEKLFPMQAKHGDEGAGVSDAFANGHKSTPQTLVINPLTILRG